MPTGLEQPLSNMSFTEMVKTVNRLHRATAAESARIRNAKMKQEAAERAAKLKARHLAEENRAVRQLQIKIAAAERADAKAARSPTVANVKGATSAINSLVPTANNIARGYVKRGRFYVKI